MKRAAMVITLAVLGAGVGYVQAATGKAVIKGTTAGSTVSGAATLTETPSGLQLSVQVAGMPPGQHGIHIHEVGACGDAGKAAGAHFNPDKAPHGFLPTDGPAKAHAGDTGNIIVNADGKGNLQLLISGLTLTNGPHAVAGRAIILHEKPDDFSQPAGNAGGRIGCGVIEVAH